MKKFFPYILILVVMIGILTPFHFTHANTLTNWLGSFVDSGSFITSILNIIIQGIISFLSWFLWLAGTMLNYVLYYTVVNLSDRLAGLDGINTAWKIIRDLMNIGFIFILVYEGILLIINAGSLQNIKKFIFGVVLASLLINFSLFFTKVLIDASNIVTVGIYNTIIGDTSGSGCSGGVYGTVNSFVNGNCGLSDKIMTTLGLQSIYGVAKGDAVPDFGAQKGVGGILVMGLGSGLLIVVTTFVFFSISIMFIVRYLTIIFLLMLSPIAYMGIAFSSLDSYSKDWWNSLKGQLLFPPIFMIMMLITLTLMTSKGFITVSSYSKIFSSGGSAPEFDSMNLLVNFAVIIGLVIASLVTSKKWAKMGSAHIGTATKFLTEKAGSAAFGVGGWAGRNTIGRAGSSLANNATLQERAKQGSSIARLGLYGAQTARSATFDARNASIPTSVVGDTIRGTIGRTRFGKATGLNNVETGNIDVGAPMASISGVGKGGTMGYKEAKAANEKQIRERESAAATEYAMVMARRDVLAGKDANPDTDEGKAAIAKMETALTKLSDKQTEALVASNRELLDSQNFANKISVKQLEAINKSEQFSDVEKDNLKLKRFKQIEDINNQEGIDALKIDADKRTDKQKKAAEVVEGARKRIKGLSDSEIEMLDPKWFEHDDFIQQLKPSQAEAIAKSSKFTSTQKGTVSKKRREPLINALHSVDNPKFKAPKTGYVKGMVTKNLSAKDVAGLFGEKIKYEVPDPKNPSNKVTVEESILKHPEMIDSYSPGILKKMALEMNPSDIQELRAAIEDRIAKTNPGKDTPLGNVKKWLLKEGATDFT